MNNSGVPSHNKSSWLVRLVLIVSAHVYVFQTVQPCPRFCTCGEAVYRRLRTSLEKRAPNVFYNSSLKYVVDVACYINYTTTVFNLGDELRAFQRNQVNTSDRSLEIFIKCQNRQTILWNDAGFLRNSSYFSIHGCRMTTGQASLVFPTSTLLERFHMSDIISDGFWENVHFRGLNKLRLMTFPRNNLTTFPGNIANVSLPVLHQFQIHNNNIRTIECGLYQNSPQLLQLWATDNFIREIPPCVCGDYWNYRLYNGEVREIHLDNNLVDDISSLSCDLLPPHVYLTNNKVSSLPVFGKNLAIIYLDKNSIMTVPKGLFQEMGKLYKIKLDNNRISTIEPQAFTAKLYLLKEVNLSGNALTEFTEANAPDAQFSTVTVDLRRNRLRHPPMHHSAISGIASSGSKIKLYAADNDFWCDCNMSEYRNLFQATKTEEADDLDIWNILNKFLNQDNKKVKQEYVDQSEWKCFRPVSLQNKKISEVEWFNHSCAVIANCPSDCSCIADRDNKLVDVSCSNLTSLPEKLPRLKDYRLTTNFSNNHLTELTGRAYFPNIIELDISGNNIRNVSDAALIQLRNIKVLNVAKNKLTTMPRRLMESSLANSTAISLSGNSWNCTCSEVWFIKWVLSKSSVVTDSHGLFCSHPSKMRGKRFSDDVVTELRCDAKSDYTAVAVSVGVSSTVLLIVIVIVTVFSEDIKVILFVKWNIDIRVAGRKNVDNCSDRNFDAFVSYSSLDGDWVRNHLLPLLENEHDPPFKTCFHERDFIPGLPITENIIQAIQKSKRTVLVVSKNFIDSEWCQFEFLTAHKTFLETKENKLIVIVVEKSVNLRSLNPKLRAYFNTKTFLKVTDRLFKEKLYYAMPRLMEKAEVAKNPVNHEMVELTD